MKAVLLLSLLAICYAQLPPAPKGKVQLVSGTATASEPGVAINPLNDQQMVVAYQVPATVHFSTDGGNTFTRATGTAPSNYRVSGDPSITFVNNSVVLMFIAFDQLGPYGEYWGLGATRNGIFCKVSPDGGKTWESQLYTVCAEDKPIIVADNSPKSRFLGRVYTGWTQFRLADSGMLFSYSTDLGRHWQPAKEISARPGLPRDDNGAHEGWMGATTSNGTVLMTWVQMNEIMFSRSDDGGQTVSPGRAILRTGPLFFGIEELERTNGFPTIAVDQNSNAAYVSWIDFSNGDTDVFVSRSFDLGATWSAPVRVNNEPIHTGRDQFFQWIAVDQKTGYVYFTFSDRRDDVSNRRAKQTIARSTDQGRTFTNYAWTTTAWDPANRFIGDYSGIAALNNKVIGAWCESRSTSTGVFVGTADFN